MIKYEFYFKDVLLGHLYIRDGQHRYVPVAENVQNVQHHVPLTREMICGREWGSPIPFFQERIENAKRFGMETCIRYHTDQFTMQMILE